MTLAGGAAQGTSEDDLLAAGRRLYSEGLNVTGEPVSALVQGDVPVLGTQMTCRSCHGRSGMGAIESGRVPSALAGPLLFAPGAQNGRPAYDEKTLARAMREGIDPAGRPLDPLMPRFQLGDRDVAALTAYLRQLGAVASPGIGPSSIRLATLIAGDVAADEERAVLDVLEAYVADKNRSGPRRLRGGHFPDQEKEPFRKWSLDVWRLDGPPEGWRAQIEARYREQPVFAVVSGLGTGNWQPIHDFCEAFEVLCLLPNIDLAPDEDDGYYSMYFSRGLGLEAEILAREILTSGNGTDVLQLVSSPAPGPAGAARRLARAVEAGGGHARSVLVENVPEAGTVVSNAIAGPASAVVLWLPRDVVRGIKADGEGAGGSTTPLLFSSTLLNEDWDAVPAALRDRSLLVHLFKLPGESDPQRDRFRLWANGRGIPRRYEHLQTQTFFACLTLTEGIKHAGYYPSRDYFMDLLNHASNMASYLAMYPRPGFGPGQRMLNRGGYLVDLSGRRGPAWMVP